MTYIVDFLLIFKRKSDLGKLYIGGITWDTNEEREHLQKYFSGLVEVLEYEVMKDTTMGRAHIFRFVVFADLTVV